MRVGFNVGNCSVSYTAGNAWTSWNQANRISIEEVDALSLSSVNFVWFHSFRLYVFNSKSKAIKQHGFWKLIV